MSNNIQKKIASCGEAGEAGEEAEVLADNIQKKIASRFTSVM